MNREVGTLSWFACETCQHYRPDPGGCEPIDIDGPNIFQIDVDYETIECLEYKAKASQE